MNTRTATFVLIAALASAASLQAQNGRIPADAMLYIEATDFGHALSAAILKKKVPVRLTTDKEKATYFLSSTSEAKQEKTGERVAKVLVFGAFAGSGKSFDASVSVTDVEGAVVFAYSSKKGNFQSAAEGVAKHLKQHVEGK